MLWGLAAVCSFSLSVLAILFAWVYLSLIERIDLAGFSLGLGLVFAALALAATWKAAGPIGRLQRWSKIYRNLVGGILIGAILVDLSGLAFDLMSRRALANELVVGSLSLLCQLFFVWLLWTRFLRPQPRRD